ncbi:universal stress protein [Kribbella sp. NPDC004875]|uniref:universal stress protein n=1 Tax=Kribbella sp. NPDC004875 TaxID=3364107 RepID=UPI00369EDC5C
MSELGAEWSNGRPVLVGYDGSPASGAAARWAAAAAQDLGQRVRIIHVMSWPVLRSTGGAALAIGTDALGREAEQLLDRTCREVRAEFPGVEIEAEVPIGDPVPVLLREAVGGALLVLGSRGLGEVRDLAEGSVMAHIATHAACPVVVVPAGWAPRQDRPGRVVVGVDGSVRSEQAIGFAYEFAERIGASITAVLAWKDLQRTGDLLFPVHDPAVVEEDGAAVLAESVAGQAVDHPDVKVTEKLVLGTASRVLTEESRDADLLVVGSRGRGRGRGLVLGSVSRAVLHHAVCPVAVVR